MLFTATTRRLSVVLSAVTTTTNSITTTTKFDAHSHIHLGGATTPREPGDSSTLVALMSTQPTDWDAVSRHRSHDGSVVAAGYGVHPWWAHKWAEGVDGWMAELERKLGEDEHAIVGEVGLDKLWVAPDTSCHHWDEQCELFERQMELATKMERPVSLHCVRAQGYMMDFFRAQSALPPRIYLHSYGGSAGTVRSYTRMKRWGDRFYFGFSNAVNARSPKTPAVISEVPLERLLLESDRENSGQVEADLEQMLVVMSEAKGLPRDEVLRKTTTNGLGFYGYDEA